MKPGIQVAFIDFTGQIGFGLLVAILTRQTQTEETTQYVVSTVHGDGTATADQLVEEDFIVSMESWNKADQLFTLAQRTEQFRWSYRQANPPVPEPEPVPPAPSTPAPSTPEQIAAAPLPASSLDNF